MKEINKKINKLWQSNTKAAGQKGLLWMALFFTVIVIFFVVILFFLDKVIEKILFIYVIGAFSIIAITFLATYGYVYNSVQFPQYMEVLIKLLYKGLIIACVAICSPMLIFIKLMELIFIRKAKRMDNFETWLSIFVIDLTLVLLFMRINVFIALSVATYIPSITTYNIKEYSVFLLLFFLLIKLEWEIVNRIILKILNHYGLNRIRKSTQNSKDEMPTELPIGLDIKQYMEERKSKIEDIEKKELEELNYDLAYQKTSLWKFQLLCLIMLFVVATFVPDLLFYTQEDAINVITIFTLVMLYLDKRKMWDKEFLGL